MDWPRARAILLAAFTLVNLILAYSIWGPSSGVAGRQRLPHQQQVEQVRTMLREQGIELPLSVAVPSPPESMPFLYVEYRNTPILKGIQNEPFEEHTVLGLPTSGLGGTVARRLMPTVESGTGALVYHPDGMGLASMRLNLTNWPQVRKAVEKYLRRENLLPESASYSGMIFQPELGHITVEYVPVFDGYPVFSGYVRAEISERGVETVRQFWVEPKQYTAAAPKAVRPATEALLRLAGRLQAVGDEPRTITEIRLGYYANRSFTAMEPNGINGWDTVPVWRVTLNREEVYYINAFNGEWES